MFTSSELSPTVFYV